MRGRAVLAALVAFTVLAGVGIVLVIKQFGDGFTIPRVLRGCVTEADGQVELSPEQMANAATIAAIGVRRGLPERAVIVALATAFQESQLRNLTGGDRDSVGLFQQRPSQGWGTPEQIQDTRYATARFYAALGFRPWYDKTIERMEGFFRIPAGIPLHNINMVMPGSPAIGRIEIAQYVGFPGSSQRERAVPPNLGLLSASFATTDLAETEKLLLAIGAEPAGETVEARLPGSGPVRARSWYGPDDELLEFHQAL